MKMIHAPRVLACLCIAGGVCALAAAGDIVLYLWSLRDAKQAIAPRT
jgi:hypothetical protein